jgi:hypothetical protein
MSEKLTIAQAKRQVDLIRELADDDEVAHAREDDLREVFIAGLADGRYSKREATAIARVVMETEDINFARWCG